MSLKVKWKVVITWTRMHESVGDDFLAALLTTSAPWIWDEKDDKRKAHNK